MTPQALFFDMDGLLLDSERVACAAFIDAAACFGVAAASAEGFFLTLVGNSHSDTAKRVQEFLPGVQYSDFSASWSAAFTAGSQDGVPLKPTVRETIIALAGAGHRMAVVTSTNRVHAVEHLQKAGLWPYFERLTGGDEVSANKPDPAPYLETAVALGVDPRQCYAFEDSDRGLTAAVRAGCQAVQIPDLRPPDAPFPALGQIMAQDLASAVEGIGLI